MHREIIRLLDLCLSTDRTRLPVHHRTLADAQMQAWSRLGGRWISDDPAEDEIAAIYAARSGGREIEL